MSTSFPLYKTPTIDVGHSLLGVLMLGYNIDFSKNYIDFTESEKLAIIKESQERGVFPIGDDRPLAVINYIKENFDELFFKGKVN